MTDGGWLGTVTRVMVEQTPSPPAANPLEELATMILGAVEQQLNRYFTAASRRMDALEAKVDAVVLEQRDHAPSGGPIDPETMLEIRQTVRDDMARGFSAVHARLDQLAAADHALGERAAQVDERVQVRTMELADRVDAGTREALAQVDARLGSVQAQVAARIEQFGAHLGETAGQVTEKLELAESRGVDRLLELEQRIKDEQGRKIADIQATVGRISGGFDEAMGALSRRVTEAENVLHDIDAKATEAIRRAESFDTEALEEFREQVSKAVGEATLVRIELDRFLVATQEKLDHSAVRLAQIEEKVSDAMDVSTAVQLERLDELERQMEMLAPYVPAAGAPDDGSSDDGSATKLNFDAFDPDDTYGRLSQEPRHEYEPEHLG